MGEPLLEDNKIREYVGDYIKTYYSEILKEERRLYLYTRNEDPILLERMVRVEESLKNQHILSQKSLEFMEIRFELMDKRFNQMFALMSLGLLMIITLMSLFKFII